MSEHYYFKQDVQNSGFKKLLQQVKGTLTKGKTYKLGIFYDNELKEDLDPSVIEITKQNRMYPHQIKMFRDLKVGDYIWIFFDKVYCFKSASQKVELLQDEIGEYAYLYQRECKCKAREFEFVDAFETKLVPVFFSTCDSNQAFNRNTISHFCRAKRKPFYEVANRLIGNSEKISVDLTNVHSYLSPKQFETLISMLFLYQGKIPDSFLGGSRKDIDLCVYDDSKRSNERKFQIKMYDHSHKNLPSDIELIHLGPSGAKNGKKIHGVDWIQEQIRLAIASDQTGVPKFDDWLKAQFPLNVFSFDI